MAGPDAELVFIIPRPSYLYNEWQEGFVTSPIPPSQFFRQI